MTAGCCELVNGSGKTGLQSTKLHGEASTNRPHRLFRIFCPRQLRADAGFASLHRSRHWRLARTLAGGNYANSDHKRFPMAGLSFPSPGNPYVDLLQPDALFQSFRLSPEASSLGETGSECRISQESLSQCCQLSIDHNSRHECRI